jgi:hypothetical protein
MRTNRALEQGPKPATGTPGDAAFGKLAPRHSESLGLPNMDRADSRRTRTILNYLRLENDLDVFPCPVPG